MKKIVKLLGLFLVILGTPACSDFLDQNSPSEKDNNTVFNSVYYTNLTLNKVYGDLIKDETYAQYIPIIWGLNSDCELVDGLGTDSQNTSSERGNMNYNMDPGWANISKLWNTMYGIIENANLVIEGVEGSSLLQEDNASKKIMLRYQAEALTLRAMVYFDLTRFFGDIPLKMESSKSDLSNAYLGKTDRDLIMDRLIMDLEEAIENLPWAGEASYTTEHITKGYAHSLLANIALTRAGWSIREKAKEGYVTASFADPSYPTQRCNDAKREEMYKLALNHLGKVIVSGKHRLNASVENQWYLINQRKLDVVYRENIFEIPMGLSKSGELGYTVGVRISGSTAKYGTKGNSSGKLKLTAPYFWSFNKKDLRRDITCSNLQLKETDGVLKEEMLGNTPFAVYCGKWDVRKMNEEWRQAAMATTDKCPTGINVVRMRYPQVLLMFAEVMNELYGADAVDAQTGISAKEALKEVHYRAFADTDKSVAEQYLSAVPSDKDGFFNAIVDENAWELAGEGFRKFDLIRWNLLSSKIDQFKADYVAQLAAYPEKVYFKYQKDFSIDMSTVEWYNVPTDVTGYESKAFWGAENTATVKTQLETYLPSIASGLNATVRNRYLLPIASTTISASNGLLSNSYGYAK